MQDQLARKLDRSHAVCIALIRESRLLIGLRHYTADKWKPISVWTCPGGRCDDGETVEQTLRRELEEETGIKNAEITDFLAEIPGSKEGDTLLLFAGTTNEEPKLMEPEKFESWQWCDLNSIPDNFINFPALDLIRNYSKSK
jgi:8-oxo-dGTP pyrophosphatase MutT (NUDIX family)